MARRTAAELAASFGIGGPTITGGEEREPEAEHSASRTEPPSRTGTPTLRGEKKTRRAQLLFRPSDWERWSQCAHDMGCSMNALVERAMNDFCDKTRT